MAGDIQEEKKLALKIAQGVGSGDSKSVNVRKAIKLNAPVVRQERSERRNSERKMKGSTTNGPKK